MGKCGGGALADIGDCAKAAVVLARRPAKTMRFDSDSMVNPSMNGG